MNKRHDELFKEFGSIGDFITQMKEAEISGNSGEKVMTEDSFVKEQEGIALGLFKEAVTRIPAYQDYVKKSEINSHEINNWEGFKKLPFTTKDDYLRSYPLQHLCWDGTFHGRGLVVSASSGSTGIPCYFPRNRALEWRASVILENFLRQSSVSREEGPTLVIVTFGMGIWVAGTITSHALNMINDRGDLPITVMTPGVDKNSIIKTLKDIAPEFQQTLFIGYPPFVKDVIDGAVEEGIDLEKLNLRFHFGAESFPEEFRDYLAEKVGMNNVYLDSFNIYGCADIGPMGWETPIAILMRRLASQNKKLAQKLFGQVTKLPTLAQYHPEFVLFEEEDRELYITSNSALPLIRYQIGDTGGVLSFEQMVKLAAEEGVDLQDEIDKAKIPSSSIQKLPFVYVFERNDFSVSLYGLQIFPEFVRAALVDKEISEFITGKFLMETKFNVNQDQYLEINVELKKGQEVDDVFVKKTEQIIAEYLKEKSSEFRELSHSLKERSTPRVCVWPYQDELHFKPGGKQKWVKK